MSYPTAWRVKHKLMQVMAEREAGRTLQGDVVIDDSYLGGEHDEAGTEPFTDWLEGLEGQAGPQAHSDKTVAP